MQHRVHGAPCLFSFNCPSGQYRELDVPIQTISFGPTQTRLRRIRGYAMKTMVLVIFLSIASLMAVRALAQEPSAQQNAAHPSQALSNKDVLTMQNVGLGPDVIIAKIKSSTCDFDTSPAALEQLRTAKVPNEVILAMVQAPGRTVRQRRLIHKRQRPRTPCNIPEATWDGFSPFRSRDSGNHKRYAR